MADTVFKVELKGIELPKDVHSAIEADIRRAVINHLGSLARLASGRKSRPPRLAAQ